jgi:putative peptidoglycan lipid II flippase
LLTRELTIAQATAVLAGSFFFSAGLGAVRQVLFNAEFGAGNEASAYYAAFRLPDTLFSLIAGGALSSAMIPVLLSTQRENGESEAWRLTGLVMSALLLVFAIVVLFGELLTPLFVHNVLAPGFDGPTSDLTVKLTRIMMLQPLVLAVGSVATAVLNTRNQFILTAVSVASHNLALIAGILATRFEPSLGIYAPTLGVVAGALLQVLILLPGVLGNRVPLRLGFDLRDPGLREVVRLLIPNGLAVGVGYAGFILDTSFASRADEAAALPAVQNAWLMVGLPIALLGQAVGQAAFPRLAAQAAALDWQQMRRAVMRALAAVVGLAVPALLGLILLGHQLIRTVFQQGKFNDAAGNLTYDVLFVYAVALPAYVATEVITRALISLRDTRSPLISNSLQLLLRTGLMIAMIGPYGVTAVPAAFAISASVETLGLGTVLMLKLRQNERSPALAEAPA